MKEIKSIIQHLRLIMKENREMYESLEDEMARGLQPDTRITRGYAGRLRWLNSQYRHMIGEYQKGEVEISHSG